MNARISGFVVSAATDAPVVRPRISPTLAVMLLSVIHHPALSPHASQAPRPQPVFLCLSSSTTTLVTSDDRVEESGREKQEAKR